MSKNKEAQRPVKNIKEVVIVEGKTDTQKLQKLFNVTTIETNGSAINDKTLNLIKVASQKHGVILFLDPDYQGNKIRQIVASHLDQYKECFINVKDIMNGSKKIGIAEATDEAIINALSEHVITVNKNNEPTLSWDEYLALGIDSKIKRLRICDVLKINYCNNKQLFKRLNLMGIMQHELAKILNDEK